MLGCLSIIVELTVSLLFMLLALILSLVEEEKNTASKILYAYTAPATIIAAFLVF